MKRWWRSVSWTSQKIVRPRMVWTDVLSLHVCKLRRSRREKIASLTQFTNVDWLTLTHTAGIVRGIDWSPLLFVGWSCGCQQEALWERPGQRGAEHLSKQSKARTAHIKSILYAFSSCRLACRQTLQRHSLRKFWQQYYGLELITRFVVWV